MQIDNKINLKVITEEGLKNIKCNRSENLLKILLDNKINILNYCNGNGTCGKCKVKFLDSSGSTEKVESACLCSIEKDSIIEIIEFNNKFEILSDYIQDNFYTLTDTQKTITNIDLKSDSKNSYGIAIDIGTTTIVTALVDLNNKRVCDTISMLNPQRKYGADVITRIQYALKHDFEITRCIQDSLQNAIQKITRNKKDDSVNDKKITDIKLDNIVVSGNTTMIYLLQGLPCGDLAAYPFDVKEIDFRQLYFKEIFKDSSINSRITLLPCISAFVGADIVSDIIFTEIYKSDSICMILDIGTNGEMVIGNKERLLCTSTAAGPVFEGANIKSGIGSIEGAVNKIIINGSRDISYTTIMGAEPVGICGSGVIDIVSELFTNNLMDNTGLLDEEIYPEGIVTIYKKENGASIIFTQKDVREVQLAKSAIRAGIEVLIKSFGTEYEKISKIYISGGFGTNINIENSINIGMLPMEFASKIEFIGNGSLGGAIKYLLNSTKTEDLKLIKDKSENLDLGKQLDFNNFFIKYMSF